jgi:hypothetical protein
VVPGPVNPLVVVRLASIQLLAMPSLWLRRGSERGVGSISLCRPGAGFGANLFLPGFSVSKYAI